MGTGDLSFLAKSKYLNSRRARKAWIKLFDEYLIEYGAPESYTRYIEKMKKAAALYKAAYVDGKRHELVRARIAQNEAEKELSGEGESMGVLVARLSKFVGFPLDQKKITVAEFYNYIELMKNG
jgi:hypothetical protein